MAPNAFICTDMMMDQVYVPHGRELEVRVSPTEIKRAVDTTSAASKPVREFVAHDSDFLGFVDIPLARTTQGIEEPNPTTSVLLPLPDPVPMTAESTQTIMVNSSGRLPFAQYAETIPITPSYMRVQTRTVLSSEQTSNALTNKVIAQAVNSAVHRAFNEQFVGQRDDFGTRNSINSWMNSLTAMTQTSIPVRIIPDPYTGGSALNFGRLEQWGTNGSITGNDYFIQGQPTGAIGHDYGQPQIYINNVRVNIGINETYSVEVDAYLDPASAYQIVNVTDNWHKERAISAVLAKMRTVNTVRKSNSRNMMPAANISSQELKARETLREMLSESEYRRYITNGFIMVKGQSGLWYQIFGNGARLKTYKDGKAFELLCIHTDSACPPSDHVINMKVLVEIDEESVRKGSNISPLRPMGNGTPEGNAAADALHRDVQASMVRLAPEKPKEERLVDLYKRLKTA